MVDWYIGEIRMFAGAYAPEDWALCDGQLLQISGNDTLFGLLGTTYGGDGVKTFGLPDLRGRVPVGTGSFKGNTYALGAAGGTETAELTQAQLPVHSHAPSAQSAAGSESATTGNFWAATPVAAYAPPTDDLVNMNAANIGPMGGGQPHDNMMPFVAVSFIIALNGLFPAS